MKIFILLFTSFYINQLQLFPNWHVYYTHNDSIEMDEIKHEVFISENSLLFRMWIWKENENFNLKIRSLKPQHISLIFREFSSNSTRKHVCYKYSFNLNQREYNFSKPSKYFRLGFYECQIDPGRTFFQVYHLMN